MSVATIFQHCLNSCYCLKFIAVEITPAYFVSLTQLPCKATLLSPMRPSYPSNVSSSSFSATLPRFSGTEDSWLYDRLNCFKVGHFTAGSNTTEGLMSFRETSRLARQFIFNKQEGNAVNLLLCKSKCVKLFSTWKDSILKFQNKPPEILKFS